MQVANRLLARQQLDFFHQMCTIVFTHHCLVQGSRGCGRDKVEGVSPCPLGTPPS